MAILCSYLCVKISAISYQHRNRDTYRERQQYFLLQIIFRRVLLAVETEETIKMRKRTIIDFKISNIDYIISFPVSWMSSLQNTLLKVH